MGCSSSSDNHIRKRKLQGNWTLMQLRKPLKLMQSRERKVKRNNKMHGKVINIQYVTLNNMAQQGKLCMATGTREVLPKNCQPIIGWIKSKPETTTECHKVCQMVDRHVYCIPKKAQKRNLLHEMKV